MDISKNHSIAHTHILLATITALCIGLVFFTTQIYADTTRLSPVELSTPSRPATAPAATSQSITHTTIPHFNPGNFYLTGMTQNTQAGGDGDGEVRLLTVGISDADWNKANPGFPALFGHAAAQKNGVIYVSGGKTDPSGDPVTTIYTTTIKSDHSLDVWRTSSVSLPVALWAHGMAIVTNTLVIVGGADLTGTAVSTVRTATINPNGTIGSFQLGAPLPEGRNDFGITVINGRIYVIGGVTPSSQASKKVFYTTPNSSGLVTEWFTTTLDTPTASDNPTGNIAKHTATSYNGRLYQIGGTDAATFFPYAYYAQPSTGGNVSAPNFTSTLQIGQNLVFASSATFGGQIHAVGGAINQGSAGVPIIFSALISATGATTGELFNPLGGNWQQSPVLSSGRIRAASVMSNDGWLYVLGGLTGDYLNRAPLTTYDYGPTSGNNPSMYAPYGTYTSPIIDVGGLYTVTNIAWNTSLTTTIGMSLTLKYYCGNSEINLTLCSAPVSGANNGLQQTKNISLSQIARYWQYVVDFTRGSETKKSPVLNWVRIDYEIPEYPNFAITSMIAPPTSTLLTSRIITYGVANVRAPSAPVQRRSVSPSVKTPGLQIRGVKYPPPPDQTPSPNRITAPQADPPPPSYLFWITFYYNRVSAPTGPNDLANAMNCDDANPLHTGGPYKPYIFYNQELGKTSLPFYARCDVPANSTSFYAQIDTCDNGGSDPFCTTKGYVLEFDELPIPPSFANNILGPASAGSTFGGSGTGGIFLPFVRRSQ